MLSLNFLSVGEKEIATAWEHPVIDKTEQLSQPIYYNDVLTLEWKTVKVLRWGMVMLLYLHGIKSIVTNKT